MHPVEPLPTGAPARPPIHALTGIRAVAAGWVVLHHFREPIYALLPALRATERWAVAGHLGVEVFFVLSGFVISHNYAEDLARAGARRYRGFLVARFARVYPVHLLTLLLTGALVLAAAAAGVTLNSRDHYTAVGFLGNLALLQAVPGIVPWNGPSWSVGCEAAAYLVFPLLAAVIARTGRRPALVWAGVVLALELLVIGVVGRLTEFSALAPPVVWTRIAGGFTLGCLLWAAWRAGGAGRREWSSRWWDVAALGSVVATGLVLAVVDPQGPGSFLTLPFLALFVVSCAGASGAVAALLSSAVLRWFGRISYSVYMTHFLLLVVLVRLAGPGRFADEPPVVRAGVVLLYLGLVCAVGALTFHAVEEPARRLIRRLGAPRGVPAAPRGTE